MVISTAVKILMKAEGKVSGREIDNERTDGGLTGQGQPRDVLHGSGEGAGERKDQAHHAEDDGAGAVVGQGVHHDGEGDQVAARREHEEQQLSKLGEQATGATEQDFACIGHAVDEGISGAELSNDIARVGGDDTHADDEDDGTGPRVSEHWRR